MAALAGTEARRSEDWCGADPEVAVVLDGVSAPEGDDRGCHHGTPWYVRNLGLQAIAHADSQRNLALPAALAESIAAVAAMHSRVCDLNNPGTPSATVAILRSCGENLEYLVLSDATIVLSVAGETTAVSDKRVENVIAHDKFSVFAVPAGSSERQEQLALMVRRQRERRNRPDGHWLAGSVPEAASYSLTGATRWSPDDGALLLSDGVACLADVYRQITWEAMIPLAKREGPEHLLMGVREAERGDQAMVRWPRFKASDDATAVLIQPDAAPLSEARGNPMVQWLPSDEYAGD